MKRALLCALLAAACGGDRVQRPLDLEIRGLSAPAESLAVKMFPDETGQTCAGVDLGSAPELSAPIELVWTRASGVERRFELPPIEGVAVTVVAVASDPGGAPLQWVCRRVELSEVTELPGGRLVVTLSRRT